MNLCGSHDVTTKLWTAPSGMETNMERKEREMALSPALLCDGLVTG